jgi:short-subunit dehydrogenase
MFHGKTVLLTGASSGIGAALARQLAGEGAKLVLVARRADRLAALAEELKRRGAGVTNIVADLTQSGACERVVAEARGAAGEIDILINNAGMGEYGRFLDQDAGSLDRMMTLNMTAVVRLTQLTLPEMVSRHSGHIVNVASVAGHMPTPYMTVYGATKAFVLSFSLGLWAEVRRKGVGVTCICPGPVRTEFFDRGGFEQRRSDFSRGALDADRLAAAACAKLKSKPAVYVPGVLNRVTVFMKRLMPTTTLVRLSARVLRP